jgi:hypothetical protein
MPLYVQEIVNDYLFMPSVRSERTLRNSRDFITLPNTIIALKSERQQCAVQFYYGKIYPGQ